MSACGRWNSGWETSGPGQTKWLKYSCKVNSTYVAYFTNYFFDFRFNTNGKRAIDLTRRAARVVEQQNQPRTSHLTYGHRATALHRHQFLALGFAQLGLLKNLFPGGNNVKLDYDLIGHHRRILPFARTDVILRALDRQQAVEGLACALLRNRDRYYDILRLTLHRKLTGDLEPIGTVR